MEPLGHGAIWSLHLGNLGEHVSFLVGESLGLLCAHRSLLCRFFRVLLRSASRVYSRLHTLTSRFLVGLVTCFAAQDGIPAVAHAACSPTLVAIMATSCLTNVGRR